MEDVVESVVAQTDGAKVVLVRLEIGHLSGVAIDALRFCFEICTHGTTLADATLDIHEIEGRARCRVCGCERDIDSLVTSCVCGSFEQDVLSGHELRLKEVEVI
ncbi:MAG: [NiFe] hydrogenase nickel incorporation protein HypA [Myxococcales bacterium]|jgi:hydrogenase nickel incorporation protein HypA/HybF|nr:[NiFe] hydrogenase nickel incorporation protein HypA [Myxococcales bacterium]